MESATIGIKTADRKFFPVLQEDSSRKRRVVLTTVHENQTSAQIDLYRGHDGSFAEAEYVGSLLLEDIDPQLKGEPDIQLVLELDDEGNLSASARELRSGSYQSLSLRLENLAETDIYDIPDFEIGELDDELGSEFGDDLNDLDEATLGDIDTSLDEDFEAPDYDLEFGEEPPQRFEARDQTQYADELSNPDLDAGSEEESEMVPSPALLVGFVILALAMLGVLSYFVFRALEGPELPPLEVEAVLPFVFLCRKGRTF